MTSASVGRLTAVCAECLVKIRFDVPPSMGDGLVCPECHTALEVVQLHPLRLTWAYEEPIADALEEIPRYGMDDKPEAEEPWEW